MDELNSFVNYLEKQYSVDDNRLQSEMQTLKRKLNVKDESQSENKKKRFKCTLCEKLYSRKDTLRKHAVLLQKQE